MFEGKRKIVCAKSQLISEPLFGVFNFPKNQCKNLMNFCPSGPIKEKKAHYYVKYVAPYYKFNIISMKKGPLIVHFN